MMPQEIQGKSYQERKARENGRMEAPLFSSHNGNGSGFAAHKVGRSYRTRHPSNGFNNGLKPLDKVEDPVASTPASEALTSDDGSSGVATPSMDTEVNGEAEADVESQKSLSSFSSNPTQLHLKVQVMEHLISNMFTTISSLKFAYVQLQSAHVPYDPDKLQVADKAVIADLKTLSELKHTYKDRLAILHASEAQAEEDFAAQPQQPDSQNNFKVLKSYEGIISNFHSEIQKKSAALENLKDVLANTTLKKEKLERRVKRLEQRLTRDSVVRTSAIASAPTPQLLESTVLGASEAARSFAKLLISLMKAAQWDLDAAANSIEPHIVYARKTHKKFAFESYLSNRMLNGFESETFNLSVGNDYARSRQEFFSEFQELRTADPAEVVSANPQSLFGKFCLKKFLDTVHPKMEESFFGNLEQRNLVIGNNHPHSQFYQSFLKLARAMWVLHRLAFSFEAGARIFQIKRDTEFSPLYMESIVSMAELEANASGAKPRVGFTVMPGFRVEKTIIKCQVYITGVNPTDAGKG